jgi:hypothetical protein
MEESISRGFTKKNLMMWKFNKDLFSKAGRNRKEKGVLSDT